MPTSPTRPEVEAVLTIAPPPARSITGITSRHIRNIERTLTA